MENTELKHTPEKKGAYEKICDGVPEAMYILGRRTAKAGKIERVKSGGYAEPDFHTPMSGGRARSIAGAELHRYFPKATIIASGWIKSDGPVSVAAVTARDLSGAGVHKENIEIIESTYNTYTELVEMMRVALEKDWKHIVLILNAFQLERAQAMYEHIGRLRDPNGYWKTAESIIRDFQKRHDIKVTFVSAEDVLSLMDPRFKRIVDEAKQKPEWKRTHESELEGARQINADEYWKGKEPDTTVKQ